MKAKKGTNFISLRTKSKNPQKPNHEVTSEVSSSKIMQSKSDMTSRTATSIISPAVRAKKRFKVIPCKRGYCNIKKSLRQKSLCDDT